jgi:HlyD family secretion protein
MTRSVKRAGIVVAALVVAAGIFWAVRGRGGAVQYATVTVDRGDIVQTVGATGTLQAVVTVQVGSQVSGTIKELHADFNSVVKKGQVIARLDPESFQARVAQARANVVTAQANVDKAQAGIEDAKQKYQRAQQLSAQQLLPAADLETAKSNYESAVAQLSAARAAVTQAQASLKQAEVDMQYTVISAPIDGVVIARNVDIGQTVAASFQAPVLFVIANDLTRMQVNASVDESDVGKLKAGQDVTFHVDAYPDRTFKGRVEQVRLQPTTTQNVVSYSTIITVANPDQLLMPGMTASVSVIVQRSDNALRVPAAALRFTMGDRPAGGGRERREPRPSGEASAPGGPAPGAQPQGQGQTQGQGQGQGQRPANGGAGAGNWRERRAAGGGADGGGRPPNAPQRATVYVLGDNGPQPTRITIGASDGQFVEVKDGLTEGAKVVTGIQGAAPAGRGAPGAAGNSNPFNPQFQRRQR